MEEHWSYGSALSMVWLSSLRASILSDHSLLLGPRITFEKPQDLLLSQNDHLSYSISLKVPFVVCFKTVWDVGNGREIQRVLGHLSSLPSKDSPLLCVFWFYWRNTFLLHACPLQAQVLLWLAHSMSALASQIATSEFLAELEKKKCIIQAWLVLQTGQDKWWENPNRLLCDPPRFRWCPKKNVKNDAVRTGMSWPWGAQWREKC